VFIEQAIFTSVRSGRNEGYQIAAASPGFTMADKHELAQWGPAHDALYDLRPTAESLNCHRMASGCWCLSRTVYAGREYSGRGGYRVYTQCFFASESLLQRFSQHPFRVLEALIVSGRAEVLKPIPDQLTPVPVVGRARDVKSAEIERVCQVLGPEKLASLVCAALKTEMVGVTTPVPAQRLFSVLLDLLPLGHRLQFSWTTGLRVSPRRPYRLAALPEDRDEQRQAMRLLHLTPLDLNANPPAKYAARSGWPLLMYELLRNRQFSAVAAVIQDTATSAETDLDLLAEQAHVRIAKQAPAPGLIMPLAPSGRETAGTSSGCHAAPPTLPGDTAR
jgi:hypothetical protein